jgi:hypothetical protein
MKKYIRENNLTEREVNEILNQGYILHSVTNTNTYGIYGTNLLYHFILNPTINTKAQSNICEDLSWDERVDKSSFGFGIE